MWVFEIALYDAVLKKELCALETSYVRCHPEALLLREGSPEISRTQIRFLGSSAHQAMVRGGGAFGSAFLSEAWREILRAKEALSG